MDLIDLYHRRGIALVRSRLRATAAARLGYSRLARVYSEQIERQRATLPAAAEFTPAV